jgi:uncharacterized protein
MRNVTGAVARGDDFFDRTAELAHFWQELETDNLLFLAPRRIGKTSILRRIEETADARDYQTAFLDVSDCTDELAFTRRLYTAILATTFSTPVWTSIEHSRLGKLISRVQKVGGVGFNVELRADGGKWAELGEELADALNRLDGRWLLEIDELPVFVLKLLKDGERENSDRIRGFLYWLRRLRLEYPAIRWILAGSIGLDTVSARLNVSDAINDLRIVSVGAFSPAVAHDFLRALADSYNIRLGDDVRERILARIGWLAPYYLQLAFSQLRHLPAPSVEDADRAIDTLLQPQHKAHFDYWRQRLTQELDRADAGHAILLVNACVRDPAGTPRETLSGVLAQSIPDATRREERLRYLLDVLVNDGYLVDHEHRFRLRFSLLREYWLKRIAPPE